MGEALNGPGLVVQDERKMIPVSPETHRRVMALASRLQAERGQRTSMDAALVEILDRIDGGQPQADQPQAAAQ